MKITEETLDFSKNDMVSCPRENKQDFVKRKESKIAYNEPYAPINNPADPYYFKPIHISLQESLINLTESDIKIFMENFSWIKKLYNSGMEFNKISISALADTMKKLEPNSVCFLLIRELLGCLDLFSSEDAFEIMRIICIETCENPAWAHQFLASLKTIFIANVYKGTKFAGKEKKIANREVVNGNSLQAVLHANYVIASTFYNYQEEISILNDQLKERNDQELLAATAQYRKIPKV
ncbi:unnamed protein product [Blepharisma stoltei]|uniref:Uncharacterized protein n=1 Tax=Blepharisma stoltei TaxID=1481888 RepID=A0AAU9JAJ3_9CILI|nr:unnamed protein product [Blepharisma stoltei]